MNAPRSLEALQSRFGGHYRWLVLIVVAAGLANAILSASIFNIAPPFLMRDFGLGPEEVHWVVTGYMLAMTVALLPSAWVVERFGFRRVFLGGLAWLTLASVGGALSPDFATVIALRIVQGMACGILMPMGMVLVVRHFPVNIQGRATGILGFGYVLAPAVAPILGGVLADALGWQGVFLAVVPGGVLAFWAGYLLLPAQAAGGPRHDFDWLGFILLLLVGLAAILLFLAAHATELSDVKMAVLAVSTAAASLGFVRHVRRKPRPILDLRLFDERNYRLGAAISFVYGIGIYGSTYLIPLYLQTELAYDATLAGSSLLPGGIALAISMPLAGYFADRVRVQRQIALGLLIFALSFVCLGYLVYRPGFWMLTATIAVGRFGLGVMLPPLNMASLQKLSPDLLAQGSSLSNCLRQVGGSLGIGLSAAFLGWRIGTLPAGGGAQAFAEAFWVVALLFLIALLLALRMRPRQDRDEKKPLSAG